MTRRLALPLRVDLLSVVMAVGGWTAAPAHAQGTVTTLPSPLVAPQALTDDAQARGLQQAMTDYLEAQQSLSFDVDSSIDVVTTAGQKLKIACSASIALQRPDKIRVQRRGGFASVEVVFDGKNLSVLNRDANVYGQADLPRSVDDLVNTLRNDFQRPPARRRPAGDRQRGGADSRSDRSDGPRRRRDTGRGMRSSGLPHPRGELQIWIAQGDQPHPCRFVITSKGVEGRPEYTLEFSGWGNGKSEFTFAVPAGASLVSTGRPGLGLPAEAIVGRPLRGRGDAAQRAAVCGRRLLLPAPDHEAVFRASNRLISGRAITRERSARRQEN